MKNKIIVSNRIEHSDKPALFVIKNTDKMREIANIPHRHDYYTVIWSFNSAGKHIIDSREYAFKPHRIFFVAPGQVHQIIHPNPEGLLILFSSEFIKSFSVRNDFISNLKIFGNSPLELSVNSVKTLMEHVNSMMDAFGSQDKMKFEIIESHLKLFLIECNRQYEQLLNNVSLQTAVESPIISNFKILVEEHFHEWHQVTDYAKELNVSSKYLGEKVKIILNQSPKEYIQNRIVLEAKRMLLFTNNTIKEIGFMLGFEDPARFSRFFKDVSGISMQKFVSTVTEAR